MVNVHPIGRGPLLFIASRVVPLIKPERIHFSDIDEHQYKELK
jgi:hypothetical protein